MAGAKEARIPRSPCNSRPKRAVALTAGARHGRAKFLHYFSKGFRKSLYKDWERGYKWAAHQQWSETLDQASFRKLLTAGKHREIAAHAVAIEARTNLLFGAGRSKGPARSATA